MTKEIIKIEKLFDDMNIRLCKETDSTGIYYIIETNENLDGYIALVYGGDEEDWLPKLRNFNSAIDWFYKVIDVIKETIKGAE